MAVKIRLMRTGFKNNPRFRIVVKPAKSKRDGKSLETLGFYNPITKKTQIKKERVEYWMSVGAQKTKTVERILDPNRKIKQAKQEKPKTPSQEKSGLKKDSKQKEIPESKEKASETKTSPEKSAKESKE